MNHLFLMKNLLKRSDLLLRSFLFALGAVVAMAASANTITNENALPGDPGWELNNPAFNREIEGYSNLTSVQSGNAIKFFISTDDTKSTINIYRVGWYGGVGGRKVYGPVTLRTSRQPMGTPDPVTGYLDAGWKYGTTIWVPSGTPGTAAAWTSGFYVAKITGLTSGYQCYIPFVVREPNRTSDLLFNSGVFTYAAYDFWGGSCFYSSPRATRISLNRPYQRSFGAGDFLNWEIQMVRFLEKNGYDVTYQTDVDLHVGRNYWANHKALLFVGHDEYWTYEMRQNTENALSWGQCIGNFAANTCYWQVRLEPDAAGNANRTIVCYKYDAATSDPYMTMTGAQYQKRITTMWRDPILNRPEGKLFGTQYMGDPYYGDIIVSNTSNWVYKNAGLVDGAVLTGILGYEVDHVDPAASPSNLTILSNSPTTFGPSNMATYIAPSGGTVFSTGSMQWSWGLDGYGTAWLWPQPYYVSAAAQQITNNVLTKFTTGNYP